MTSTPISSNKEYGGIGIILKNHKKKKDTTMNNNTSKYTLTLALIMLLLVSLFCGCISSLDGGINKEEVQIQTETQTYTPDVIVPTTIAPTTTAPIPTPSPTPRIQETSFTLTDAVEQELVDVQVQGTGYASGSSIVLNIQRLEPRFLQISVEPGTVLVNSIGSQQDMIVRQLLGINEGDQYYPCNDILLTNDRPEEYLVEAYCLNYGKDNPSEVSSFSFGNAPSVEVLAVLDAVEQIPAANDDIHSIQCAIWVVSDDVSQSDLAIQGYEPDRRLVRSILQKAGFDPEYYQFFGGN